MHQLPPLIRAPVLGLGLGLVAGGFEAIGIGSTVKLALSLPEALLTGTVSVLLGGLLGLCLGILAGLFTALVTRGRLPPARHALGMATTAAGLAWWHLGPLGMDKLEQGMVPAAMAFWLMPIGVGGVIFFNAHYWLRREDIGERRRLGWWFWSLAIGLGLAALSAVLVSQRSLGGSQALASDPAVVLVTMDTLRRDHVSIYGDSPVQTPAFEALAARGIRYDNAITPFPETAPAHAALFTGRHPVRNGVLSNGHALGSRYLTLAEVLEGEGYATAAFVSSFAVDSRAGLDQGFEVYDDDFFPTVRALSRIRLARLGIRLLMKVGEPTDYPFLLERDGDDTVGRALDWAEHRIDPGTPFFLWVHLFEPHSPYEAHDEATAAANPVDHRDILADEPGHAYTEAERSQLKALYAAEVVETDRLLAQLVAGIEALRGDQPVLWVVTADHGEQLGEHGVDFNHHGLWEDSVRVPLVIVPHDPKIMRSLKAPVVEPQVRLMDVPATVLAMLKLDPMEDSEGDNTLQFAQGLRTKDYASLLMGRRTASLREGSLFGYRAALVEEKQEGEEPEPEEATPGPKNVKFIWDPAANRRYLFKLAEDPDEEHDIAAEQEAAADLIHKKITDEVGKLATEGVSGGVDPALMEGLRALGYQE